MSAWTLSALLLLTGAAAGVLAVAQADGGGYFSTSRHRFTTAAAALKTDAIDVGSSSAHAADPDPDIGELARVRVKVDPVAPDVPVSVGIGPKDEVEAFLRGTAYDDFVSAELKAFRAHFRRVPGAARSADPTRRTFWVASSSGTGPRTLTWNKTHGAWSVAVLRLDGTSNVDVRASIGLRFAFLTPLAIGCLAASLLWPTWRTTRRLTTSRTTPPSPTST
ncbi:hypothetical protein [Actinomadura harenae]|uniref:DUF3068 domain-containing protein n=1 Tax=Actinomadura harenae TaxID=2483351 RepID=A0A3M2MEX4_9ACTN|nr:hypothetical protein [Actinomadura harenae]RMI47165.1 hypothetical protein EBO15_04605 [Actinomadura harenae]